MKTIAIKLNKLLMFTNQIISFYITYDDRQCLSPMMSHIITLGQCSRLKDRVLIQLIFSYIKMMVSWIRKQETNYE